MLFRSQQWVIPFWFHGRVFIQNAWFAISTKNSSIISNNLKNSNENINLNSLNGISIVEEIHTIKNLDGLLN